MKALQWVGAKLMNALKTTLKAALVITMMVSGLVA